MFALVVLGFLVVCALRLRLDVIVGLFGLWALLAWLSTGPQGMTLLLGLGIVAMVVTMIWAEFYRKAR
jgi:hypothetical protein